MSGILIIGSLAYDLIASTRDALPAANVKLDSVRTDFGGCGGNLAYNFSRLGQRHVLHGHLGALDAQAYQLHLDKVGATLTGIRLTEGQSSARAFIFTDPDGTQFTAFHPLQVDLSLWQQHLETTLAGYTPDFAIIAPDLPLRMLAATRRLRTVCPLLCYAGQYTAHLTQDEATELLAAASIVVQNEHEHRLLPVPDGPLSIVTRGAQAVYVRDKLIHEFPVPAVKTVDPTGCGDAFTAAFTHQWLLNKSLPESVNAGIAWAQRCLAHTGSQAH